MGVLRIPTGRGLRLGGKLAMLVAATLVPDPGPGGAGTISIVEPQNFTVRQHINNSRIMTASATFDGDITLIEARVVPIALDGTLDSSKASAWTPIETNLEAKTAAGSVQVPEGGWYVWQMRDSVKTGIAATGVNRFGVGEVVLWIGQSNNVQALEAVVNYPSGDPRFVEYVDTKELRRAGTYADYKPPNTHYSGGGQGYGDAWKQYGSGTRGDCFVFFGNLLSQGRNVPVLIVPRSYGGTSMATWLAAGGLLETAITAVNEIGGDCGMAIWYQGEANADAATSEASYRSSLGQLHNRLMTAFGRNASNFKLGIVALSAISNSTYTDGTETQVPAIRRAQIGYANETPGAFLAGTGCDFYTSDAVHLSKASQNIAGRRRVKSALHALGVGNDGAGPRIAGASRSGLTVDVAIQHTGGTNLADGIGGTGADARGFRFFDNGAPLAHTVVGIVNPTTIRLTLAAAPAGVLTMDYANTNAPFHADPNDSRVPAVAAWIIYDNAYYHGSSVTAPFALSTVGCPLQPCGLITVTGA